MAPRRLVDQVAVRPHRQPAARLAGIWKTVSHQAVVQPYVQTVAWLMAGRQVKGQPDVVDVQQVIEEERFDGGVWRRAAKMGTVDTHSRDCQRRTSLAQSIDGFRGRCREGVVETPHDVCCNEIIQSRLSVLLQIQQCHKLVLAQEAPVVQHQSGGLGDVFKVLFVHMQVGKPAGRQATRQPAVCPASRLTTPAGKGQGWHAHPKRRTVSPVAPAASRGKYIEARYGAGKRSYGNS